MSRCSSKSNQPFSSQNRLTCLVKIYREGKPDRQTYSLGLFVPDEFRTDLLTNICQMDSPIIVTVRASPLSFSGASGVIFRFYLIFR